MNKYKAKEKLFNIIVEFARKEGLTIANTKDVFSKVCEYFEGNATLENTTPKSKEQCLEINIKSADCQVDLKYLDDLLGRIRRYHHSGQ